MSESKISMQDTLRIEVQLYIIEQDIRKLLTYVTGRKILMSFQPYLLEAKLNICWMNPFETGLSHDAYKSLMCESIISTPSDLAKRAHDIVIVSSAIMKQIFACTDLLKFIILWDRIFDNI